MTRNTGFKSILLRTWEEGYGGIFTLGNHPWIVSCCVITLLYSVLAKEIQLQHKAPVLDIEVSFQNKHKDNFFLKFTSYF